MKLQEFSDPKELKRYIKSVEEKTKGFETEYNDKKEWQPGVDVSLEIDAIIQNISQDLLRQAGYTKENLEKIKQKGYREQAKRFFNIMTNKYDVNFINHVKNMAQKGSPGVNLKQALINAKIDVSKFVEVRDRFSKKD